MRKPKENRALTSTRPVRRAVTGHTHRARARAHTFIIYKTQWKHIARYRPAREALIMIIRVYSATYHDDVRL